MRISICGNTALTAFLLALSACGGGSDDQQSSNSNSTSSVATETTAECYFVPGDESAVNVGPVESEEAEQVARAKDEYFIASCTGDVSVTIDNSTTSTTTTAETTTNVDSGNVEQ